jgi:PAS domain S-box-containing protein
MDGISRRRRMIFYVLVIALLHLSNPLGWGCTGNLSWFPTAGLVVSLLAWYGARAAVWAALDGLLVVTQAWLLGWLGPRGAATNAMDAIAGPLVLALAWRSYQGDSHEKREFDDPLAAKRFLFLLPCLGVGMWATVHAAVLVCAEQSLESLQMEWLNFWLSRSLGLLVSAPLMLTLLSPWLVKHGLAYPFGEWPGNAGPIGTTSSHKRMGWGDGLELLGLAMAAGAFTRFAVRTGQAQPIGWELWGAPLLMIIWGSLRQGLRGAVFVAAVSASTPLLLSTTVLPPLVQINLLGQCSVALLVASSASWIRSREERYQQLARHLPVVLYSARFRRSESMTGSRHLEAEISLVSAGCESLLGCSPRELLGDHELWLARVHADDRELLLAAVAQLSRQMQPVTCEYRLLAPGLSASSKVRWLRDTLAPHFDEAGRLIGWEGMVAEITEQRELADDLRRTTNMLHALVGNLPAGVYFVQGPLGHPLLVNARARQLLGQREDLAASLEHLSEVYRLHRPDGTPYPVEQLPVYQALRKGVTSMRSDIVVHRPDGRRAPLVSWAAPIRFPSPTVRKTLDDSKKAESEEWTAEGGSEAAVWVMEDMTALHQAEAARRDTETRLRTILETMSEGVIVWDHNACILDCNTSAATLLGTVPENLRGMTLSESDWLLLREDGTPLSKDNYPAAEVLHYGRPVRNRVLAIVPRSAEGANEDRPHKDLRWLLVNAMPLGSDNAGQQRALGVVSTYIDITTAIRAQRLLRESEEKYRDLVESLPIMLILAEPDMHICYANPAVSNQTGYDLSEVSDPAAWSSLVHPDDASHVLDMAQAALRGESGRAEFRYRAKDGSEKVGLAFAEPRRRSDGEIIGTTTLIADVTRERQLEQQLLRTQRLELVGRLSSGIAHDFNNLLSVVLSLTELVTINLPADHATQEDLGRIKGATIQAANLAGQLLTFSKQRQIATRRFDLNPVTARTLELLRATLPARIELRAELAQQELFVLADETQVQQVLMNLCLNARDAMPNGGLLVVRTERISTDGEWVRLSVCDNGVGLSETVKSHLFDPFFSTKERGTGLGLAVVRQIVESHGGKVEAVNSNDQGARFDVWWPASI